MSVPVPRSAAASRPARLQLRARSIALGALVAAGVVAAAWIAARSTRVLGWVVAAVVMAALLSPLVEGLVQRGLRRGVAVPMVLLGVLGTVALVLWAGIGDLRAELDRLRAAAPEAAADVEAHESWIGEAAREFQLRERVDELLDDLPARLAGGSPAEAVQAAASRGIAVLITTILTIFLIGHGPRLVRGALRQVPEDRRPALSTRLHLAYRRTWRYAIAVLAKAIVVGLAVDGIARVLDLPAPNVLGLVVGLTSVIPKLGVVLGGLPVVLLAAGVDSTGAAIVIALVLSGLQVLDALVMDRWIEPAGVEIGPAVSLAVVLLATSLYGIGGAAVGMALAVFGVAVAAEHLPPLPEPDAEPPEPGLP